MISGELIEKIRKINDFIIQFLPLAPISQHNGTVLQCLIDFLLSIDQIEAPMLDALQMLFDHTALAFIGMLNG